MQPLYGTKSVDLKREEKSLTGIAAVTEDGECHETDVEDDGEVC